MTTHLKSWKIGLGVGVLLIVAFGVWTAFQPLADDVALTMTVSPQAAIPGDEVTVSYTLTNNGTIDYPAETHALALTLTDASSSGSLGIKQVSEALAPNQATDGTLTWSVSSYDFKADRGPFTLNLAYLVASDTDSYRVITETKQTLALSNPLASAIEALSLSKSSGIAIGDRVTISYRIKNQTNAAIGGTEPIGIHLGYRTAGDPNALAVITALTNVIQPGETLDSSFVWKVDHLPSGSAGEVVAALIGTEANDNQQFAETATSFTVR